VNSGSSILAYIGWWDVYSRGGGLHNPTIDGRRPSLLQEPAGREAPACGLAYKEEEPFGESWAAAPKIPTMGAAAEPAQLKGPLPAAACGLVSFRRVRRALKLYWYSAVTTKLPS
jgi:hypothetical protein